MKRLLLTLVALTLVLTASSVALADQVSPDLFIADCIQQRIANSEREASAVNSTQEKIRYNARVAAKQAQYYQTFQDTLIYKIKTDNVSLKRPAIEHYMIRAFYDLADHSEMAMQ